MSKPRVLVTRRLPEPAETIIREVCEYEVWPHPIPIPRDILLEKVRGVHGILSLLTDRMDAEAMDAAGPNLKVISNYAVGYDNVVLEDAKARGIVVTNTPGVLTETTADLTWALLMAAARRIAEGDRFTRSGEWKGWDPLQLLGVDVFGKTLGIIGLGRIGVAVARRATGFQMRILYTDVQPFPDRERETGARYVSLDELLRESDFISIHSPLTPQTRHLINAEAFRKMKPTAVLVNAARGPVVDEVALVEALREGRIFAAGLDVYENEPRLAPGLANLPNVVLAPHLGSASRETRAKMAELAAKNLVLVLQGKEPLHRVV
ncbi:MAG: 2-hydroxyacid dehydrogenase [bacterium JZ-2024 1]